MMHDVSISCRQKDTKERSVVKKRDHEESRNIEEHVTVQVLG
jgi:hypothetical protein